MLAQLLGDDADPAQVPLLRQALTHRSAGPRNNERLEFVGDALLGLVIADALWQRFPDADEGELSRRRAALVNKESLAGLARGLRLGDYLCLGPGETRTGGHARDSILADALEAVIGAVYQAQGFAVARDMVLRVFAQSLARIGQQDAVKDPKTRLQEILQARRRQLPDYALADVGGKQHAQRFAVHCRLPDLGLISQGEGTSRRRAEQDAAEQMLKLLQEGGRHD
ncbi:ribonuclease III [Thiohalocapsa marina]|nr:ribonuclease III [Thiohalocapsa marina]